MGGGRGEAGDIREYVRSTVYGGGNKYGRAVVGVIQLASASGNFPPSTTLNYTIITFSRLSPLPKGEGRESGKAWIWGWGAEDDRERGKGRPDEVGRISIKKKKSKKIPL